MSQTVDTFTMNIIYCLRDENGSPRYVGKTSTKSIKKRLSWHLQDARANRKPCYRINWLRSMLSRGLEPTLDILEHCGENWQERERYWIVKGKESGWRLTNGNGGGYGMHNPTPETLAKMSAWQKGKPKSPETRAKLSVSHKGKILSEEHKSSIRKSCFKGYFHHTPETKERIRQAKLGTAPWLGKKHSEKTKAKIRMAVKIAKNWKIDGEDTFEE